VLKVGASSVIPIGRVVMVIIVVLRRFLFLEMAQVTGHRAVL